MEEMNEKKQIRIDSYLDSAREAMRRLAFTPNVGVGHLIVQRRPSYNIVKNRMTVEEKGKQIVGSSSVVL